jgi:predicted TIM-barrel fold metal-dependent hydrolase
MNIIDCHCHIYPIKVASKAVEAIADFYNLDMRHSGTVAELIQISKQYNVEKMLVHCTATREDQVYGINNYLIGELEKNPEFVGFGTLHPNYIDNEKEMQRLIKNNVKGIKVHPDFCQINVLSKKMYDIYEMISGKLSIMFHIGDDRHTYSQPQKIKKVLKDFPNLTVIGAHMGGYTAWEESYNILCGEDIYFDTSSSLAFISPELATKIIKKHGAEKVLFATDYPMWHIKDELELFLKLPLSDSDREKILYNNAKKLLKI